MRIAYFCFILAALAGVTGISLGIWMGINQDFSLAPAHAHVNLLGWVTMSLYGLYHRVSGMPESRLAWVQAVSGGVGFPSFTGGLAVYLATGNQGLLMQIAIMGSLLCLLSMVLFLVVVLRDAASVRPTPSHLTTVGW